MAASERCVASTEPCWCPSECDPNIACICGGGRFLGCQERTTTTTACSTALAAVQAKCAGQPNVQYIGGLCTLTATSIPAASPTCVAQCLSNLATSGSCSEIDCYFCPNCDCAPPAPSPFRDCLAACPTALAHGN